MNLRPSFLWTLFLLRANNAGKILSVHLTKWTGKSRVKIHPKNLARPESSDWYAEHVSSGARVLDVGCGTGAHAVACSARGAEVDGFDYSDRNLKLARTVCRDVSAVRLFKMNAESRWALKSGCFDVILLLDVLEHLNRRQKVLAEAKRALRPGGHILLSLPKVDTRWKRRLRAAGLFYYTDRDHKVEYTDETLREEIVRAGLEITWGPEPIVYDTPLAGWIDLAGGFSLALYRRWSRWKREMALRHPEESIGYRLVVKVKE